MCTGFYGTDLLYLVVQFLLGLDFNGSLDIATGDVHLESTCRRASIPAPSTDYMHSALTTSDTGNIKICTQ